MFSISIQSNVDGKVISIVLNIFYPHVKICFLIVLERKEGKQRKWGGEREEKYQYEKGTLIIVFPVHLDWGSILQHKYVLWPNFELTNFGCNGQHLNQLSHLTKTRS